MTAAENHTQRRDLRERRAVRSANSQQRQQQMWNDRYSAAETPLDLLGLAYSLLRGRLVQHEDRAAAAAARATTGQQREDTARRLQAARAEVEEVCGEVAEILARVADRFDTTRK